MKETVVDFRTSNYFSGAIQFMGLVLTFIAVLVIPSSSIATLVLLTISLLIFTSHYRLALHLEDQSYHDYLWILGMKTGDRGKFQNIDYLFIRKARISQTMHLRAASSTVSKEVYEGYLRFSEQNKVHLMTRDSKNALIARLRPIAKKLKVTIIDYSEQPPKEV